MRSAGLFSLFLVTTGCAHLARPVADGTCRPNGMDSRAFPQGDLSVNIGTGTAGNVEYEVVMWTPNSPQARAVRMTVRWEAHPPAEIDFDHGLILFDSERLWRNQPSAKVPKKLTLELRANREGPWEDNAAFRGAIALQFGVRLAAEWADAKAMAFGRPEIFLITRSKGVVMDTVALKRSDFELPLTEINAFRAEVRARATGPSVPCDPSKDVIVT